MKKVRVAILLVLFGVITLALSMTPIMHLTPATSPDVGNVGASTSSSQDLEKRFSYIGPGAGETGIYYINKESDGLSYMSLRSEYFPKEEGVVDPVPAARPVFSQTIMGKMVDEGYIATAVPGVGNIYNPDNDRAAFIMLDDYTDSDFHNRVVLEFNLLGLSTDDLTHPVIFEASYNGMPFRTLDNAATVQPVPPLGNNTAGEFVRIPTSVDNAGLRSRFIHDENTMFDAFNPDSIYWGQTGSGAGARAVLCGMFAREGYYQFFFSVASTGGHSTRVHTKLSFGFYIARASSYLSGMPVFDLDLTDRVCTECDGVAPCEHCEGGIIAATGEPLMKGLKRPSHTSAFLRDEAGEFVLNENGNRIPIPTNPDRFFYNFQNTECPSITYRSSRFGVNVTMSDHNNVPKPVDKTVSSSDSYPEYVFDQLGTYQVDAWKQFPLNNSNLNWRLAVGSPVQPFISIRVPIYSPHRYYVDIFGFQAHYWNYENEKYEPFSSSELGIYSDATGEFSSVEKDFIIDEDTAAGKVDAADDAIKALTQYIDLRGKLDPIDDPDYIQPTITNQPPVTLRYNVAHAFADEHRTQILTRVAYRRDKSHPWQFDNPYGIDRCSNLNNISPYADCIELCDVCKPVVASDDDDDDDDDEEDEEEDEVVCTSNCCRSCVRRITEYIIGRPFETAGEYAVIVYYEYHAAEPERIIDGQAASLYHQIFYFRINDFAADIMFQIGEEKPVSFAELAGLIITAPDNFKILYRTSGSGTIAPGPFETIPRIDVHYNEDFLKQNWVHAYNFNELSPAGRPEWFGKDGVYVFKVFFGNNQKTIGNTQSPTHMPVMEFTVIVDTKPIQTFFCYQGGDTTNVGFDITSPGGGATNALGKVQNVSLFGPGSGEASGVTLSWKNKQSMVDMINAEIEFYEFGLMFMCRNLECDQLECRGFHYSDDVNKLVTASQYRVLPVQKRSMRVVQTKLGETGDWRLAESLNANGLFSIRILDAAGVYSRYIIIIDKTEAAFSQNPAVDPTDINMLAEPTTVGFGKDKLIRDTDGRLAGFFSQLQDVEATIVTKIVGGTQETTFASLADVLKDGPFFANDGIIIPIPDVTVTITVDGTKHDPVEITTINHTVGKTLEEEGEYLFIIKDLTGNTAEHRLEINFDKTKGIIFEDGQANVLSGAMLLPHTDTVTRLRRDMVSSRDFLSFRFDQAEVGEPWRVHEVHVAFYELTFADEEPRLDDEGNPVYVYDPQTQTETQVYDPNPNYPFSSRSQFITGDIGGFSTNLDYELRTVKFEADDDEIVQLRRELKINRLPFRTGSNIRQRTLPGLYVIARICNDAYLDPDSGLAEGQPGIMHYRFIVDDNPIISDINFETGTNIRFGSGVNVQTARHKDFQKGPVNSRTCNANMNPAIDRVLRTNDHGRLMLPGIDTEINNAAGTKYGAFQANIKNNTFKILNWDTGEAQLESKGFDKALGIGRYLEIEHRDICLPSVDACEECGCAKCEDIGVDSFNQPLCNGFCKCAFSKVSRTDLHMLDLPGMYRIILTDGSGDNGSYSWITDRTAPPVPQGNRSEILVEYIGQGPEGVFELKGRRIPPSSSNAQNSTTVHHSTRFIRETDILTFRFVIQDTSNFLRPIGTPSHPDPAMRPYVLSGGVQIPLNAANYEEKIQGSITYGIISFPITEVPDGHVFSVRLNHGGANTPRRTFVLMLDNTPPRYNLNEIRKADRYFNDNRQEILSAEGYGIPGKPFSNIVKPLTLDPASIEIGNGNVLRYPFSLSRNYSFNRPSPTLVGNWYNGTPIFDAFRISYYRVDSRLSNISGEQTFNYNDPRPFFDIVREAGFMPEDDDNRFFRIVERDEAGNRADYFVQLRGPDYVDEIFVDNLVDHDTQKPLEPRQRPKDSRLPNERKRDNFISPLRDVGSGPKIADPVSGYEMSLFDYHNFFTRNLFFDLSGGGVSIRRFGLNVMYVDGQRMLNNHGQVINDATPERFAAAVQRMLLAGRGASFTNLTDVGEGGAVNFHLNNRFDHANRVSGGYYWQVRQITRHTPLFGIKPVTQGGVVFEIDDSWLPGGLAEGPNFFFQVYNLTNRGENNPLENLTQFGRECDIQNINHEYLIVATDEFGRTARYSHNGVFGHRLDIRYDVESLEYIRGTPSQDEFRDVGRINGELYFGNEVEITFAHSAYHVELWRDGVKVYDSERGGLLDESLEWHVIITLVEDDNKRETILVIRPEEDKIVHWEIKAYRIRGKDPLLWTLADGSAPEFWMYGELPVLRFTNQSGEDLQEIDGKGDDKLNFISNGRSLDKIRPISGIVTMTYSLDGLLFGSSVEYWHTWTDANGESRSNKITTNPLVPRHNFVHEGRFDLIVTNSLGFSSSSQRYIFIIDDLSNRHYRVSYAYGEYEKCEECVGDGDCDEDCEWVETIEVLAASPRLHSYGDLDIPNYFVRHGTPINYATSSSILAIRSVIERIRDVNNEKDDAPLIIAPTENSNRVVSRVTFPLVPVPVDTVIYRIHSPVTGTNEFIAITIVPIVTSFASTNLNMINDSSNTLPFTRWPVQTTSSVIPTTGLSTVFAKPASGPTQPAIYDANSKISVGLSRSIALGGHEGNQLYVDYYRVNFDESGTSKEVWEKLGTLTGDEKLSIYASDYGVYTFRVRDQAGNVQNYSGTTDASPDVPEVKDYTTLINLARGPLYIREGNTTAPIIDGMVYSNNISLSVVNLPYGLSLRESTFATKMQVYHNGVLSSIHSYAVTSKSSADFFRTVNLSAPGNYRVEFSYQVRIGSDDWATDVNNREYHFTLVSSSTAHPRQSFSYITPKNVEITSIRLNGNEIRGRFADTTLRRVTLNSSTGNGIYLITLRLAADNIHQQVRTKAFTVVIGQLPRGVGLRANVGSTESMAFGFSVSGNTGVLIEIDSRTLVNTYGDCRIIILREGADETIVNLTIGHNRDIAPGDGTFVKVLPEAITDVGRYSVYIATIDSRVVTLPDGQRAVEGSVFISQGFRITSGGASPLVVIILIVVAGLVVVAGVFFIRLRTGMRTK